MKGGGMIRIITIIYNDLNVWAHWIASGILYERNRLVQPSLVMVPGSGSNVAYSKIVS